MAEKINNIMDPSEAMPGQFELDTAKELIEEYYEDRPMAAKALEINNSLTDAEVPIPTDQLSNLNNISDFILERAFAPGVGKVVGKTLFGLGKNIQDGAENLRLGWNDFMDNLEKDDPIIKNDVPTDLADTEGSNTIGPDNPLFKSALDIKKFTMDKLQGIGGQAIDNFHKMLGLTLNKLAQARDILEYPSTQKERDEWNSVMDMIATRDREERLAKYRRYGRGLGFQDVDTVSTIPDNPLEVSSTPESRPIGATMVSNIDPLSGKPYKDSGPYIDGQFGPASEMDYITQPFPNRARNNNKMSEGM